MVADIPVLDGVLRDYQYTDPDDRPKRSSKLKKLAMERDKFCQCCYRCTNLEVHHIHPLYVGGAEDINNMIVLCGACHSIAPDDPDEFLDFQAKGGLTMQTVLLNTAYSKIHHNPQMTIAELFQFCDEFRQHQFELACKRNNIELA